MGKKYKSGLDLGRVLGLDAASKISFDQYTLQPGDAIGTSAGRATSAFPGGSWSTNTPGFSIHPTTGVVKTSLAVTAQTYTRQLVYNVTVNGVALQWSANVDILCAPATSVPSIAGAPVTFATRNAAYTGFTVSATGGAGGYSYSVVAGTLPAGITLNATTGLVSGTPTTLGTSTGIIIRVTDKLGATANLTAFSIAVASALTFTGTPVTTATQGVAYAGFTATAAGGTTPYAYSGTLPPGLSINASTGVVSGTPSTSGTYASNVVRVTDAVGRTAQLTTFQIVVGVGLSISGSPVTGATQNTAYVGFSIAGAGGTAPYTYSVAGGTLPTGITLNSSTGALSGTPTGTGASAGIILRVTDAVGSTANLAAFTITVAAAAAALAIAGTPVLNATQGVSYTGFNVTGSGGTSPYAYTVLSGSLPTGVTLNSTTGIVSGTPSVSGAFASIVLRVTDNVAATANLAAFTLTVAVPLQITGTPATTATTGAAYSFTAVASGGTQPYSYAIVAGSLPTGLTLNTSTGNISGTASVTGTFPGIVIRATDALGRTADLTSFSLNVSTPLTISGTPTLVGTVGTTFAVFTITGSGGTAPLTYSVASGSLPAGVSLNTSTGVVSGSPTTATTYSSIVLRVTDSLGRTANLASFSVVIGAALSISGTPVTSATQNAPYTGFTVSAAGGTSPYVFSVFSGSLPAGITLNTSTGVVSGTPTGAGTFASIIIRVTDAVGTTKNLAAFTLTVAPAVALSISGTPVTAAIKDAAYPGFTVTASGGVGPYTYSVFSGTLPTGLSLNSSTGAITGTPTVAGNSAGIVIRATDSISGTVNLASFSILVSNAALTISGTPVLVGTVGTAYAGFTVTGAGGSGGYTYSVFSGALPTSVTINSSTGAVSGTPSASGIFTNIVLRVTDSSGATANLETFAVQVTAQLAITATPVTTGTSGTAYTSFTASATGGTGPYTFSVGSGTLPPGITINATTGVVSGTPTTAGTYASIVLRVTDSLGATADRASFTITVSAGVALGISGAPVLYGVANEAYAGFTVTGTNGTAPYTYSVFSGALPAGVTLNTSTGVVSGTPTVGGYFTAVIRVTDNAAATANLASFTMNVVGVLGYGTTAVAASANATVSVAPYASIVANAWELLIVQTGNQPISTPSGWTELVRPGMGTAGAAGATMVQLFQKRQGGSVDTSSLSITGTYEHLSARRVAVGGADATSPFVRLSVNYTVTQSVPRHVPAATTALSSPATTTDTNNCLVASIVGLGLDSTAPTVTSFACSSLTNAAATQTWGTTTGNGGAVVMKVGNKVTAGTTAKWTGTVTSARQVQITFVVQSQPTVARTQTFSEDWSGGLSTWRPTNTSGRWRNNYTFNEEYVGYESVYTRSLGQEWELMCDVNGLNGYVAHSVDANGLNLIPGNLVTTGLPTDNYVSPNAGGLVPSGTAYTLGSGMISSANSFLQTYGWFEARMQQPNVTAGGCWTAWWTYNYDNSNCEIDIFEWLSIRPWRFEFHTHDNGAGTEISGFYSVDMPTGFDATALHTYAAEWRPTYVAFFIDGVEYYRMANLNLTTPMHLIADHALLYDWNSTQAPDSSVIGSKFIIKDITVYA